MKSKQIHRLVSLGKIKLL